jgi:hypothetical protein
MSWATLSAERELLRRPSQFVAELSCCPIPTSRQHKAFASLAETSVRSLQTSSSVAQTVTIHDRVIRIAVQSQGKGGIFNLIFTRVQIAVLSVEALSMRKR